MENKFRKYDNNKVYCRQSEKSEKRVNYYTSVNGY